MATYSALGNRKKNLAATPAPDTHAEQQAGCDLMSRDSGCCKISINLLQNATRSSRSSISYVPSRNIVRVLSLGCNCLSSMKAINIASLYMYIRSSLQIETLLIIHCLIFDSLLFYTRQLDVKEYMLFLSIYLSFLEIWYILKCLIMAWVYIPILVTDVDFSVCFTSFPQGTFI